MKTNQEGGINTPKLLIWNGYRATRLFI